MDFKELWEEYINGEIFTISDKIIDFFSKKVPDDIKEAYDIEEMLEEFVEGHYFAKEHDVIEQLDIVLRKNNPQIYREHGAEINAILIEYYCSHQSNQKLKEQVNHFFSNEYLYENLVDVCNNLLHYQHLELVSHIIKNEYENIENRLNTSSDEPILFLDVVKYYIFLEQLFVSKENVADIDFLQIKETDSALFFNFSDNYYKVLGEGLKKDIATPIDESKINSNNAPKVLVTLEMQFLKYMRLKNCSFPIAHSIFSKLAEYCEGNGKGKLEKYFSFKSEPFSRFIGGEVDIFTDNRSDIVLILWGASYFLDFLFEKGIISKEQCLREHKLIESEKTQFKSHYKADLWEFNFIFQWEPSTNIGAEVWEKERLEFEASYEVEPEETEISDEIMDGLLEYFNSEISTEIDDTSFLPTEKIGRNEKVSVQYMDGFIVHDIKYKKVINDLENGNCKLI